MLDCRDASHGGRKSRRRPGRASGASFQARSLLAALPRRRGNHRGSAHKAAGDPRDPRVVGGLRVPFGGIIRIIHVYNTGVVLGLLPVLVILVILRVYLKSRDLTRLQRWRIAGIAGGRQRLGDGYSTKSVLMNDRLGLAPISRNAVPDCLPRCAAREQHERAGATRTERPCTSKK